ncbi:hypothetical protein NDU88_001842 [Pleurodeles waltl]|uniref:Uncharacterized protein n=1 Tax=Pleurodeles waltl TaxID=8319 RepID=A0AAV7M9B3_PLEWA|nr:hypothetical protein NDU88_001842 [Pleurodeles waltl]
MPGPHNGLLRPTHRLSGSARSAQVAAPRGGAQGAASSLPPFWLPNQLSCPPVRGPRRVALHGSPGSQPVREPTGAVRDAQQNGAVKASSGV